MECIQTEPIVAETIAHARLKVAEQELIIVSMKMGDPRLAKALVVLRTLRENLAAAELNDAFQDA